MRASKDERARAVALRGSLRSHLRVTVVGLRHRGPALGHLPRFLRTPGAIAPKRIEPMCEVDVITAQPTFGQNGGNCRGGLGSAFRRGCHHHAGQPWRQRQLPQAPPFFGDPACRIDCSKIAQQRLRLGESSRRRRIEEGELRRVGDAPLRQIEHQGREIAAENFRLGVRLKRRGLSLVPQPQADARLGAAGAAATLVGGGARDPYGFQPRQPHVRLVARHAREPGVDHDAHTLDGD